MGKRRGGVMGVSVRVRVRVRVSLFNGFVPLLLGVLPQMLHVRPEVGLVDM